MTGGGTRLPIVGEAPASGVPPCFQRVAIVGLGVVGGSLAMAVREAWPQSLVIGVDTHDAVETAIRLHAIDVGADDLVIAGEADLVVLAAGGQENLTVLPFLADAVAGEAVVLVLGAPRPIASAAQALPDRFAVVAGRPSVDVGGAGIRAAAGLFRGCDWPVERVTGPPGAIARVHDLIRAVGGVPVLQPPAAPSRDAV